MRQSNLNQDELNFENKGLDGKVLDILTKLEEKEKSDSYDNDYITNCHLEIKSDYSKNHRKNQQEKNIRKKVLKNIRSFNKESKIIIAKYISNLIKKSSDITKLETITQKKLVDIDNKKDN